MNVVCGHCSTAYEFDDALVAKRGTMVKCSRCAHQFRVFPNAEQEASLLEDRWLVRKPSGKSVEFAALRELQQALIDGSVTVADELSRDGKVFKPIHAVPELESFLPHEPPRPPANEQTLTGMPSVAPVSSSALTPRAAAPITTAAVDDDDDDDDVTAVYSAAQLAQMRRAASKPTPSSPPSPSSPPRSSPPVARSAPPTVKTPTTEKLASKAPSPQGSTLIQGSVTNEAPIQSSASKPPAQGTTKQTPSQDFSAVSEPPKLPEHGPSDVEIAPRRAQQQRRGGRRPLIPGVGLSSTPTASDPEPDVDSAQPAPSTASLSEKHPVEPVPMAPPPSRGLRWVLGLLLLGGIGLVAATLGKDYLQPYLQPSTANRADARIDSMLSLGHELYRQNDLEGAKEQFDRANALSQTHPGVLEGQLLIQLTRCDTLWLSLRLLPEDSADRQTISTQLAEQIDKLQVPFQRALDAALNAPELSALILDGYRIQGQQAAARKRAGELSAHATEPRTAYVLAMLDLADEEPVWPTVIERLRTALGVERLPGRAGAALVYALARSGDMDTANIELERLQTAAKQHALSVPLAAFVQRSSGAP